MAYQGRTLQELAAEIERRAEAKRDFVAPIGKLSVDIGTDNKALMVIENAKGIETFPINQHAHGQLAEYAGIPMAYYRRMQDEAPDLLAANANRWLRELAKEPKARRMVRTLDGGVRAILSDAYRALENEQLAEAVLPVLLDQNLLILSCEVTDRRLYIKAVDRGIERDVPTGKKMGDGTHTFFDTCSPAIIISNSEVGAGALSIETAVYTKVCTNLAMIGNKTRRYHTGKRAELSDDVYALLTDATKRATDQAVWMQTRDLVKSAFELAQFDATLQKLGGAAKDVIPAEHVTEVIERTGKRFSLNDGERKGILAKLIEGGDLTRYGLHSAVTLFSQEKALTYDRATELERLGGDVIELAANDWQQLVAA